MDIDKGLGNANKIMNRLLFGAYEDFGLQISTINGEACAMQYPEKA